MLRLTIACCVMLALCASNAAAGVVWYTADPKNSSWSHLYSVDTATGTITDRGVIHGQRYVTDLAMGVDGTLYGVGWANDKANGSSKLYRITPGDHDTWADWEIETVKSSAMDRSVNAAAMRNGDMYVASADGEFQKLEYDTSKDRWEVARSANLSGYRDSGGDLVFSADGNKLFVALEDGYLGSVNFDSSSSDFGKTTTIGDTGYANLFGLAIVDGQLYGTTVDDSCAGTSYLVRIDPFSGDTSNPILIGDHVFGATSDPSATIPEPMTMLLLAIGAAVTVLRYRRQSAVRAA